MESRAALISKNRSGGPAKVVRFSDGNFASRFECAIDKSGKVTDIKIFRGDKEVERISYARDASGNVVTMSSSDVATAFGETMVLPSRTISRAIVYRKPGDSLPATEAPKELEAWLDSALGSEKGAISDAAPTADERASASGPVTDSTAPLADEAVGAAGATSDRASVGNWIAFKSVDPLTDKVIYFASLESSASDQEYSWSAKPSLWLRNREGCFELFITVDSMLDSDSPIALRFDSDPAMYLSNNYWSRSKDYKAAFLSGFPSDGEDRNLADLVELLKTKKKLLVQAPLYGGKTITATFDLPGLAAAVEAVVPFKDFLGE